MSYLEKAKHFLQMQNQGQTMEAFEKYYADDCIVTEVPTGEVRNGKEAQREAIKKWFEMVEEVHGGGVKSISSNEEEGTTSCEVWYDLTFKGGHRTKMEEVGIQKWRGDQIVEERFYYNAPPEQES